MRLVYQGHTRNEENVYQIQEQAGSSIGIDCGDTEEKWKEAVAKYELPWTNVINGTEEGKDLTVTYNISGFPTKLVIDPEGNIAKIVIGEDPAFYETIDGFMK